ncbi:hypothetical protein JOB18_011180 [Solea senegalensis]|uniref:Uncharacterized protein n=1 Tax=Solea senegalensis TaxID=28829 RepID=A0AAV6Q7C9_SOLSE|nr:hypothetical protein JOB18_011180 [Solea senegalensis]
MKCTQSPERPGSPDEDVLEVLVYKQRAEGSWGMWRNGREEHRLRSSAQPRLRGSCRDRGFDLAVVERASARTKTNCPNDSFKLTADAFDSNQTDAITAGPSTAAVTEKSVRDLDALDNHSSNLSQDAAAASAPRWDEIEPETTPDVGRLETDTGTEVLG